MEKRCVLICVFALVLNGCGGGGVATSNTSAGANTGSQSTVGQAQGVYSGNSSAGSYFESIVLPSDMVYALYGTLSNNTFLVSGMITGQGTSNNGTYSAQVKDFFLTSAGVSGSLSGTYVAGSSFNGTLTESGSGAVSFTGAPLSSASYNYNMAAQVSTIVGSWNGDLLDGTSATVTVNSDGSFAGTNLGCLFSGTVVADSSEKNFFDVTIRFGGSPCVLANQSASGIGVSYLLPNGVTRQLIFAGTAGSFGTVFIAAK